LFTGVQRKNKKTIIVDNFEFGYSFKANSCNAVAAEVFNFYILAAQTRFMFI
jgi:hypothetical protein